MLDHLYVECGVAAIVGLLSHWTFFIRGEHDLYAANIARIYIAANVLMTIAKCRVQGLTVKAASWETAAMDTAYVAPLFSSMIIYRLLFHPLRHIPGPWRLRWTKITHLWDMAYVRNCDLLHRLREPYGDVVRTGPSEVTVFGTDAFYTIHGPESTCRRAPYYDLLHPMVALDTARDPHVHTMRRKVWDQAFSMRSLEKLEPMVYEEVDNLIWQLRMRQNQPLDMSTWLEYYTFDLMGRFGLTIRFNNLANGAPHPIMTLYHMAHRRLGPLAATPWIKHLMMGIPYIERMKYYRQFMGWVADEVTRNIVEMNKSRVDVMSYVIDDAQRNGGVEKNWHFVTGDFVQVIAAGNDPMRQVLVNMLFYLVRDPKQMERVRAELDTIDVRNYRQLQLLPHLTACIHETLRLNPAVPSAGSRIAPKGGFTLNGAYIPEGTTVVTPQYSLMRDERNFVHPNEWIPERFTTCPELILDKRAFVAWATGKYSCVGKNMSLLEIRVAAAQILKTFDIEFAPGEDGTTMFREALDFFTTTPGALCLVLKEKKN